MSEKVSFQVTLIGWSEDNKNHKAGFPKYFVNRCRSWSDLSRQMTLVERGFYDFLRIVKSETLSETISINTRLVPNHYKMRAESLRNALQSLERYQLVSFIESRESRETNTRISRKKSHKQNSVLETAVSPSAQVPSGPHPSLYILDAWNDFSGDLPKVTRLSDSRRRAARLRWDESFEGTVENTKLLWDFIIKKIAASDFCNARVPGSKWRPTIDWILKPNNWTKVQEGNYDNVRALGLIALTLS